MLCLECGHPKAGHYTADHTHRPCVVMGAEGACGCGGYIPTSQYEPCRLCHHSWEEHFFGTLAVLCQRDGCKCSNAIALSGVLGS